jgi:hypothetical protein
MRLVAVLVVSCLAVPPVAAAPVKKIVVGPNVVLEIDGMTRRVVVASTVCLRKGPLEGLLTRAKKKEHEYVLAADIDARHLHTALTLAGAKPGSPVQFQPKYQPATGTGIRLTLRYPKGGKTVTVPAGEWIRHSKTRKAMEGDWVFAGSRFVPDPEEATRQFYIANHGDVICVCNMESALLDLPIPSPKRFDARLYEADAERIPEIGTKVEVILEPILDKKGAARR